MATQMQIGGGEIRGGNYFVQKKKFWAKKTFELFRRKKIGGENNL